MRRTKVDLLCPWCARGIVAVRHKNRTPEKGDVVLCPDCLGWGVFYVPWKKFDLSLRRPWKPEEKDIVWNYHCQKVRKRYGDDWYRDSLVAGSQRTGRSADVRQKSV